MSAMAPRTTWELACAAALAVACAHAPGSFVWVDDLAFSPPPAHGERQYVISPGDQLSIRVFNQEGMSARVRVRGDGRISLPFLGDVPATGTAPPALAEQIQTKLKQFVVNPIVTVAVEESRPFEVFVVGNVARPGRYSLEAGASVLQAIATAGGLTGFATRDRIFVVRQDPAPVRIRFRYEALTRLEGKAAVFRLMSNDSVVVE